MSLKEWIYSSYPNPSINGRWGLLHIITLILCIAIIVAFTLVFKNKNERTKRKVLFVFAFLIFIFEVARRIINLTRGGDRILTDYLYILLPRPWCAISCWCLMLSVLINKKTFYAFSSISSLICALIFFAYPSVGFNNQYILFENLYSISTHSLILVMSILLITLKLSEFEYKDIWKVIIYFIIIYGYAFFEMKVLGIEKDPMYFMANNDIHKILGVSYPVFLVLYVVFFIIYINIFYLIAKFNNKKVKE